MSLAIQAVCAIALFVVGMVLGLAFPEKSSSIVCPEVYDQDSIILPTRFGKLDEADINGTKWTVVHDESSNKFFLHVSQGSIYELERVK